jgi:tetratricopeptide (TPR) repeat protein
MSTKRGAVCAGIILIASCVLCFSQTPESTRQQIESHTQQAQAFLQEKKPDLAIPEFQAVVALDPDNLNARANLGVLLFFRGDYAQAAPNLRAALSLQPNLPKIQVLLGMSEKRTGDPANALKDLEASYPLIEDNHVRVEAGMELIELYTASNDLDKAAVIVGQLRQAAPDNKEVLYAAYRIHSDLAGEAMLALSLVAPDSAQMHQIMAHEEARQGHDAVAIAQFQKAIAIDPKLPGIHFELAELLANSQDMKTRDSAEAEYKAALAANRFDEKAQAKLGDVYTKQGNLEKAYEAYTQALLLQPDDPDANFGLAKTLISMEQPAKALPVLERAVQLDPTNAAAHFRLSTLYREQGRPNDAKHEVEEYKKYKEMKEKLQGIYKEMQVQPAAKLNDEPNEP